MDAYAATHPNKVSTSHFGTSNGVWYNVSARICLHLHCVQGRGTGNLCVCQSPAIRNIYMFLPSCARHPMIIRCFDPAVDFSFPFVTKTPKKSMKLL